MVSWFLGGILGRVRVFAVLCSVLLLYYCIRS